MILTKYILYILKKVSRVFSPSNEPCVDSAPEPNIESELPNAVIRGGRIGYGKPGKVLQILRKIPSIFEFITRPTTLGACSAPNEEGECTVRVSERFGLFGCFAFLVCFYTTRTHIFIPSIHNT